MESYGKVRVGRRTYRSGGGYNDPKIDGYKKIICLTKSTAYGSLGPYELKDKQGRIMENIFQFSKLYKTVPKSVQRKSRYDSTIIWDHPAETHLNADFTLTDEYFNWREKGMNAKYPIRYPVGMKHRHECICSYKDDNFSKPLNYIQSRKRIYVPLYMELVKPKKQFEHLKNLLKSGINLLIIEVDGPHEESMEYYKKKYHVDDTWISNDTINIDEKNMKIMLNDTKHPFGHGYCLGMALLEELGEFSTKKLLQ